MILDPWYVIFDKAGDLADSLLQEQPKSEVDLLDIDEQIIRCANEIIFGEVKPKEDWSAIIGPVNQKKKIDEKIKEHFDIALRQSVFVRILYEYHMEQVKKHYSDSSQPKELLRIGEDMLTAFACAQQHATAWRLLTEVRDKSFETRSQNANQVKAEKKEEEELILRSLIDSHLYRLEPRGGWRSHILAAQRISVEMSSLAEFLSLPILNDKDKLSEKVVEMIWKDPRLRKSYNKNTKNPLNDPLKSRRVTLNIMFGEEQEK